MAKNPLQIFGVDIVIEIPEDISFEILDQAGDNAKVLAVGQQRLFSLWRYDGENGQRSLIVSYAEAFPSTIIHYKVGQEWRALLPISRGAELEIESGTVIGVKEEVNTGDLLVYINEPE